MAQEWIKASLALKYVALGGHDYAARLKICERAHHGMIPAKAERIIWNGQEEREKLIGKGFWWAEGHEALEQDWQVGDFTTWIDHKFEVKAFGVSFDFAALSELVPADKQAEALRAISVLGDKDWISATDLYAAMLAKLGPINAGEALSEACRLPGAAVRSAMKAFAAMARPLPAPCALALMARPNRKNCRWSRRCPTRSGRWSARPAPITATPA